MKKTKSIFFKIALYMTPIVLALDMFVLLLSYNIVYESNQHYCEKQIRNAASSAAKMAEGMDLKEDVTQKFLCEYFSELCGMYDITYLFIVEPDLVKNSETYLAIGFGDDADPNAKETRYPGVTVEGMLNEEEIEAYKGNKSGLILHEMTTFGDSLVCYMPSYSSHYIEEEDDVPSEEQTDEQTEEKTNEPSDDTYATVDEPVAFDPYTGEPVGLGAGAPDAIEERTQVIVGAEISLSGIMRSFQERFSLYTFITITMTLVLVISFAIVLYLRVSRPIRKISGRMSSFVTDREKDQNVEKLVVKGNDEFSMVANSFNIMTDEIDRFINDIDALNREKHTQEAELNIARRIQMGLLQPDRTDGDTFSIRAYMLPAKHVGGDLYDYRLLDDGRIFVTIADVSGKGTSAALFMSRALTLLHQYAAMGYTPAQILTEFNNTLAAQNPGGMFITTFVAFYDPAAGMLTYSNAGHNFPYILSDRLITLEEPHGVAAGLFAGEEYEDATVPLAPGDSFFLYTDGVNEAKNKANAFYTTERLEKLLTGCLRHDSGDSLDTVLGDLNRFTRDAEQSDDITMLSLHIKPRPQETVLHLTSELPQLVTLRGAIDALPVSDSLKRTVQLAAEEMFVNICSYAYETPGDVEVRLGSARGAELTFIDSGKPFDPTADVLNIDDYDHEHTVGGLGRFMTFTLAASYRYAYQDGKNILYLSFSEVNDNDRNENA